MALDEPKDTDDVFDISGQDVQAAEQQVPAVKHITNSVSGATHYVCCPFL
jgi:hypothetical protein